MKVLRAGVRRGDRLGRACGRRAIGGGGSAGPRSRRGTPLRDSENVDMILKGLRLVAIDEISIGKGHRYLTVVFIGERKGADALDPF